MGKYIGIAMIVVGIILIIPLIIVATAIGFSGGGGANCSTGTSTGSSTDSSGNLNGPDGLGPGGDKPPEKFIPIYQAAAARFNLGAKGPSVIAGIHYEETKFGDDGSNKNGGPYEGPMAWGHAYFDSYAVAHDGKSKKDQSLFNVADSAYATANRLKQAGAPGDWHSAIYAYNHSNEYVSAVLADADKYNIPTTGGGSIDTGTGAVDCTGSGAGGGTVSGDVQQLAQQILNDKNVSFPLDAISPNGSTEAVLKALASGKKAPVTCSYINKPPQDVNPGILKFILEYAQSSPIGVNAITDKCHSSGLSNHYTGEAVDIECKGVPFDVSKGDSIAKKYGGGRNSETCGGNDHWHYDFLKKK